MNNEILKNAVAQVIKENGNEEITGNILQQVLIAMINSLGLGFQFIGEAKPETNPGTPDARVFYFAQDAGTYSNFDGLVLDGSSVAVFFWGDSWTHLVINIPTTTGLDARYLKISDLAVNTGASTTTAMTQKAVSDALSTLASEISQLGQYTDTNRVLLASTMSIPYSDHTEVNGWVDGSNKFVLNYGTHKLIPVNGGDKLKITGVVNIFILKSYTKPSANNLNPDFATGTDTRIVINGTSEIILPSDARYVALNYKLTSTSELSTIKELISGDWDYLAGVNINYWQVVRHYNPVWRSGTIGIVSDNFVWYDDANRVCTLTPIRMKKGDIISLIDYSDARFYPSCKKDDGTVVRGGWITSGYYICPNNGYYVIVLSNLTEAPQTSIESLANLVVINNADNYTSLDVATKSSADMAAYFNLWKVQNIRISNNLPWEWTPDNTRVSTQFPIKLLRGQVVKLASYSSAKLFVGWRDIDGNYHAGPGWITSGEHILTQDGWYVFNIASVNETVQTSPYDFAKLLTIGEANFYDAIKANITGASYKSQTYEMGNSGSLHADITILDKYSGYGNAIFFSTAISGGGYVFVIFRSDNGKLYVRVGNSVTTMDESIVIGKRYVIDVVWNNGAYSVTVNGEEKTGSYTNTIHCSCWYGVGYEDTKCVYAICNSALIDNNSVAIVTNDYVNLPTINNKVYDYLNKSIKKAEDDVKATIPVACNPFVNRPFYAHYRVDQFMKDGNGNNIIANGSLEEIEFASRLGFDFVEIKPKVTSDGYYINMHGVGGNFSPNVYATNGDDIQSMAIDSVTLAYIKEYVRYNSYLAKYRTAVPTLEEVLICCKEHNISAFVEAINNDIINICRQYLDDNSLILYSPPTNVRENLKFKGMIMHWFNNSSITIQDIMDSAKTYGNPFMAGIGWNTISGLGDSGLKQLIKALHDNNSIAAFASHGLDLQKYFRFGGDACAADYEVNPFEANYEVYDINGDVSQFDTTGILADGICTLTDGQKISCGNATAIPLGKAALKLNFVGEVVIRFGSVFDVQVASDGSDVYFDSTYLLNNNTQLTITSVGDTIISELLYKTSKC